MPVYTMHYVHMVAGGSVLSNVDVIPGVVGIKQNLVLVIGGEQIVIIFGQYQFSNFWGAESEFEVHF